MHFCVSFLRITDAHRPYSNTNDVRETPLSSSSPSSSPNATNNRKFVIDDDLLVEDPNGLNNVEYIKLKKVLVQSVHDVDVLPYEPEVSSELGTGKKYFLMINIYELCLDPYQNHCLWSFITKVVCVCSL